MKKTSLISIPTNNRIRVWVPWDLSVSWTLRIKRKGDSESSDKKANSDWEVLLAPGPISSAGYFNPIKNPSNRKNVLSKTPSYLLLSVRIKP